MTQPDGPFCLRPRASEAVTLVIPSDTLDLLRGVAQARDMPPEALMKFYIGLGLRQDMSRIANPD